MLQTNPETKIEILALHPGDRLVRVDGTERGSEFTVLTVLTRETEAGQTVSSLVLRQREGWTVVVGENALRGAHPQFAIAAGKAQIAA